jgi:hypothetical protein
MTPNAKKLLLQRCVKRSKDLRAFCPASTLREGEKGLEKKERLGKIGRGVHVKEKACAYDLHQKAHPRHFSSF